MIFVIPYRYVWRCFFHFFIVYCRSRLAEFARIAISPGVMTDLSIKEDESHRRRCSTPCRSCRLCQETEEVFYRLVIVQFYYRFLTALYRLPLGPRTPFCPNS